ncbi:MAG: hypothetical protein Q9214_006135 [Letrouitia sp. 1 TL-2023]
MRINSLTQLGGLNSLENFARSWQRAATFLDQPAQRPTILIDDDDEEEGSIGSRQRDISPIQQRSILRQQLEREASSSEAAITGEHGERDQLEPIPADSTPRRSDGLDHTPLLASSYASSFGGVYGSLSSHANDSALRHAGRLFDEQQAGAQGDLDKEREPLLVKRVQQEDGSVVHQIVGQSTLYQTIFNSVNVLIGIGTLSLPLGFRYSGWLIGMALLFSAALATNYTAKLLAKCLDRYPAVSSFSELASAAFGPKARLLVEILIDLELTAACVALIVLFADSLNDLIPGWEIVEWKVLCGIVVLPLNFLPLRYLGLTSILGIFCSSGRQSLFLFVLMGS